MIFLRLYQIDHRPPLEIVPEISEKIPLIHFEKIENGVMHGKTGEKEVRFIIGQDEEDAEIFTSHGGEFNFPVIKILPMLSKLPAPEWANFVASSRGSKYWPLDTPEAFLLSVKNRTFFASEEDAMKAGYEKGQ